MKITVLLFGQLAETIGSKELQMDGYADSVSLMTALHQKYPLLAQSKYVVAVNQQMIAGNTNLTDNSVVALLPPFSGG